MSVNSKTKRDFERRGIGVRACERATERRLRLRRHLLVAKSNVATIPFSTPSVSARWRVQKRGSGGGRRTSSVAVPRGGCARRVDEKWRVGYQDTRRLARMVLRGVEGCAGGWRRQSEDTGDRVESRGRKGVEEGSLGGWLVMHCANSPRRGHVTRTPGLSLIAPRRNVGHTVPTKHCTLHLTSFRRTILKAEGRQRNGEVDERCFHRRHFETSSRRSMISCLAVCEILF